jgi:hypothetical protein
LIATEHDMFMARVLPQPFDRVNAATSLPDRATLEIDRATVPEFVSLTF